MRKKDTLDVLASLTAVCADACAMFAGFMLAAKIRFDSAWFVAWFPVTLGRPTALYSIYAIGSAFATLLVLLVFRSQNLYVRPQIGSFLNKIPRLIKAIAAGVVFTTVLAFAARTRTTDYSRLAIAMSFLTILFFVLLERYVLYRVEWNAARHSSQKNSVLILGADPIAAHLMRVLQREPMLRCKVAGFLKTDEDKPDPSVPSDAIKGSAADIESFLAANRVDQVILTNSRLGHERIIRIMLLCQKNLIAFNMVPDLFSVMTASMDVQSLDDIPLLGAAPWPLDLLWNRALKRAEDIIGAVIGLTISAPVVGIAAMAIKRSSPGPVFYRQERCGEHGRTFMLCKLRTMRADAESQTGPVFAVQNDPRATSVGSFFRRHNMDELPQFWNVLKGDMSLVGPRPERPHFVEQFREDIGPYMRRHVSKPGMTGWAQVNGLRGDTSIEERVKYDLYYLENWSLAFDFKILLKTIFARENAY